MSVSSQLIVYCLSAFLIFSSSFATIYASSPSSRSSLCEEWLDLGMESRDIPDSAITASSSYNEASVGPTFARLNSEISGGAWCPHSQLDIDMSGSEWIQVNLTSQRFVITAISTQGRFGNGMGVEFVEEYWVEYSRDGGKSWHKWKSQQGSHVSVTNDAV